MTRAGPLAALASAAAWLAGCAVGPDATPPAVPSHATGAFATESPDVDRARPPPDDWWRLYDDAQLSRFVAEALAANTDLRAAAANLQLAQALLREARAGRYPSTQLSTGLQYGRNLIADSIAGAFHKQAENQFTDLGGVDVAYEVDLFGRIARSIEAAGADAEAVAAARDAVRVSVAAETTRAYVAARAAAHEREVARRSAAIADDAVAIVQRQAAAGGASEFDVARVRVVADQARAQLPAFEGRRRAAILELTALLGRVPADAAALDEATAGGRDVDWLAVPLPVGDGTQLLARRPDVRQSERRLAAATARVGVATAALYPRVSFGGSLGFAHNEVLRDTNAFTLSVGPLVSWSFPNQAVARARIAQGDAAAAAALAGFDGTVLRALKEVEQAIAACDAEGARHVALVQAEADAANAYRLSGLRRREGVLSQLDLLTSEQSLLGARAALAASDTRIADAQVSLFKALGGGWGDPGPR